jgi:hypothetical protein
MPCRERVFLRFSWWKSLRPWIERQSVKEPKPVGGQRWLRRRVFAGMDARFKDERHMGKGGPDGVAIIGAGPAGLTAGLLLFQAGVPVVVVEADPLYVGGISRTFWHQGFHFDIGGHRFSSKSKEVEACASPACTDTTTMTTP